ncbi:MAG: DUF1559 domain-containing protein [Planctomycetota bacterium]
MDRRHRLVGERVRWRHRAFTIVELLVAVAIVGTLVAILLPAVQSAREAARRTACVSNLRQVAIGLRLFHQSHRAYPQGGWGHAWIPIPDRGVGSAQPGGWVYQTLPFFDEQVSFDAVAGIPFGADSPKLGRVDVVLPLMTCSTRRSGDLLRAGTSQPHQRSPRPAGSIDRVFRGDYAINSGASHAFPFSGPMTLDQGDSEAFWELQSVDNSSFTGISHLRRSAREAWLTDGTTKTYLVGEKFIAPQHYLTGQSSNDDDAAVSGYASDNHRFAASRPAGSLGESVESIVYYPPAMDTDKGLSPSGPTRFGGAHHAAFHIAYCDGSVSAVDYGVDREVHYFAAHRSDGGQLSQ